MIAAFVFLSADKTAAESWLLGVKHLDGKQEAVKVHDDDPHSYHLAPDTPLGAHLTSLLAGAEFEKHGA